MQLLQTPMLPLLLLLAKKFWTHECIRPILTVCSKKSGNSQAELEKEGDPCAAQHQVNCRLDHQRPGSGLGELRPFNGGILR
jgi:hypothetical protein